MNDIIFSTERLCIRNLKPSDLEDFHQYRSNPEVAKYQGFDPFTWELSRDFIDSQKDKKIGTPGEWVQFGIESIQLHQLIGDCAVHLQKEDPQIAELGITISDLYQRQGYAKETMGGLMQYLFQEKNILRVIVTVDAENEASIQLMKSLSFRQSGHFIQNVFFKGKWGSEFQFTKLASEWI